MNWLLETKACNIPLCSTQSEDFLLPKEVFSSVILPCNECVSTHSGFSSDSPPGFYSGIFP